MTKFSDYTFGLTLREFVRRAADAEPLTRQRMIGQLEGSIGVLQFAGDRLDPDSGLDFQQVEASK